MVPRGLACIVERFVSKEIGLSEQSTNKGEPGNETGLNSEAYVTIVVSGRSRAWRGAAGVRRSGGLETWIRKKTYVEVLEGFTDEKATVFPVMLNCWD
jgi:hypothetical protein